LNNWLELRSDAVKICLSQRRPVPQRADSIGPWLNNISILSWLGALTTSTLIYLFQGGDFNLTCDKTTMIALLLTILIAEHGYWVIDRSIGALSRRVRTTGEINVRKEEYSVRRRYLQNIGLSGDYTQNSGKEHVEDEDPLGFWNDKNVEGVVAEGKEVLSKGWDKRKSQ
jgi:anoctamin-10